MISSRRSRVALSSSGMDSERQREENKGDLRAKNEPHLVVSESSSVTEHKPILIKKDKKCNFSQYLKILICSEISDKIKDNQRTLVPSTVHFEPLRRGQPLLKEIGPKQSKV